MKLIKSLQGHHWFIWTTVFMVASLGGLVLYIIYTSIFDVEVFSQVKKHKTLPVFSILGNPVFLFPNKQLQQLAKSKNSFGYNHFCVVGYHDQGADYAEVFWQEKNKLILWEPSGYPSYDDLITSRRVLDLKTDVVNSAEEVNSSTYLVAKQWVGRVLNDCQKYGTNFLIKI